MGWSGGSSAGGTSYLQFSDQQASTTAPQTGIAAATWTTVRISTEVSDVGGYGSLAANVITLQPGTYRLTALVPVRSSTGVQLRWRNTTDGTTVLYGASDYTDAGAGGQNSVSVFVRGRFTIATAKAFELQIYTVGAAAVLGGPNAGVASGEGESYADVVLERES